MVLARSVNRSNMGADARIAAVHVQELSVLMPWICTKQSRIYTLKKSGLST
jgi:hypothetical protein